MLRKLEAPLRAALRLRRSGGEDLKKIISNGWGRWRDLPFLGRRYSSESESASFREAKSAHAKQAHLAAEPLRILWPEGPLRHLLNLKLNLHPQHIKELKHLIDCLPVKSLIKQTIELFW